MSEFRLKLQSKDSCKAIDDAEISRCDADLTMPSMALDGNWAFYRIVVKRICHRGEISELLRSNPDGLDCIKRPDRSRQTRYLKWRGHCLYTYDIYCGTTPHAFTNCAIGEFIE